MWSLPAKNLTLVDSSARVRTAVGGANDLGAWEELIASSSQDADLIRVVVSGDPESALKLWSQLGIGPSGPEQVIMPCLPGITFRTYDKLHQDVLLPLPIPAGSRIAARSFKAGTGPGGSDVQVYLYNTVSATLPYFARSGIAYGCGIDNTATNEGAGVSVTPGTGEFGTWVPVTESALSDHRFVFLDANKNGPDGSALTGLLQVGVGASGGEVVVGQTSYEATDSSRAQTVVLDSVIDCAIAQGDRIAVRALGYATSGDLNIAVVGH